MDGEGRERCEMQTGEVALIAVICFGVTTGGRADRRADNLQTTCCSVPAPYDLCPEFSDTLDITKGTRHEQASMSIFVSASVCPHQTVAHGEREREIPYSKGTLRASGPPYTKKGGWQPTMKWGLGRGGCPIYWTK